MMNKTILCVALSSVAMLTVTNVEAVLPVKAVLDFDAGVAGGNYGFILSGSYFAMDNNSDDIFKANERTGLNQTDGLILGTTQAAGEIDQSWVFFSNNGNHVTTTATTVSNATGNTADIDFSGWVVFWNNVTINMGSGASNGVAKIVCDVDCAVGDGYTLDYFATVPDDGATNFGNVKYTIHLEGTVASDSNQAPDAVLNPLVTGLFPNSSAVIDLASNVSDLDGDGVDNTSFQITYTGSRTPPPTINDDGSGMVTYTDNEGTDTVTPDTFTYTVADSLGKISANFLVEVNVATIIAPIANPFSVNTDIGVAGAADVIANSIVGSAAIDATSVTVSNLVNLQSAVANVVTGIVTYTPDPDFAGTASFDYTVDDSNAVMSNVATVTINVNAAPVTNDDAAEVDRNSSVVINVLANDTDSDGTVDATTVIATDGAFGTTVLDAVGMVTYTPAPNTGSLAVDSFTYTVKDNKGLISNSATVTITVNNAVPVAVNDTANIVTSTDTSVTVDVTANDMDFDGTIDAGTIIVTGTTDGSAVVNAGKVDFTPDVDFIGSATFTYTVQDNDFAVSNEAEAVISVSDGATLEAVLSINAASADISNSNLAPPVGSGSWFNMEASPGILTFVPLNGFNGLKLGEAQLASEITPDIDNLWNFFGNKGVHQTTSPVNVLTNDSSGNVTLAFVGWDVSWSSITSIPLPDRSHDADFIDGVAKMTCADDCSIGDTYIIEYSATVPPDTDIRKTGFGNVKYFLHLEGTIFPEGSTPTIGGCNVGVASAVADSRAVDSNCQPIPVSAGNTATAMGNITGTGLTADEIGLKDPRLNTKDGKQCIGGCVDFIVEGVTSGGFVEIVFKLNDVLPAGTQYRKLLNGVWVNFDESSGDKIGSAASADTGGDCLGPEDEYQSGLREGSDCLFMRITDNGPNDADITEGLIVDPSGVLLPGSPNTPSGSSSGCSISPTPVSLRDRADWMIVAVFLILMGMLKYRRRNNL